MADKIVVLQAGVIEQVGAPLELYNNPRNRFVAGFIGSPKMNFLDAQGGDRRRRGAEAPGRRQRDRRSTARSAPATRSPSACGRSISGSPKARAWRWPSVGRPGGAAGRADDGVRDHFLLATRR